MLLVSLTPVLGFADELVEVDGSCADEGEDEVFPQGVEHDDDEHPAHEVGDELAVVVHR